MRDNISLNRAKNILNDFKISDAIREQIFLSSAIIFSLALFNKVDPLARPLVDDAGIILRYLDNFDKDIFIPTTLQMGQYLVLVGLSMGHYLGCLL